MNICVTFKLIILLISFGYVRCADSSDQPGNPHGTTETDDEDNFEVTETSEPKSQSESYEPKSPEPVKPNKSSIEIIFMKHNEDGVMVPMDEGDYKKIFEDPTKMKYIFQANLQMILRDYRVVYEHMPETPYASSLRYYRINNVFIIQNEDGFLFITNVDGEWLVNSRKRSGFINLYTKDSEGNYIPLGEKDYYVTFSPKGSLNYEFKSDVNCSKIMYKHIIVWKKRTNEPYPAYVGINKKKDIVVYFGDYFMLFLRKQGYKFLYRKPITKSRKPK